MQRQMHYPPSRNTTHPFSGLINAEDSEFLFLVVAGRRSVNAITFSTVIRGSQRMTPTDFGDQLLYMCREVLGEQWNNMTIMIIYRHCYVADHLVLCSEGK